MNQNLRTVIAASLCMAVFGLWLVFLAPHEAPKPPVAGNEAAKGAPAAPVPPAIPPAVADGAAPANGGKAVPGAPGVALPGPAGQAQPAAPGGQARPALPEKLGELLVKSRTEKGDEATLIQAKLSSRGAGITEALLPEFRARSGEGDLILIPQNPEGRPIFALALENVRVESAPGQWTEVKREELAPLDRENWNLEAGGDGSTRWSNEAHGISLLKEVTAPPPAEGPHHLLLKLTLENRASEAREFHYRLWGPGEISSELLRAAEGTDLSLVYGEAASGGTVMAHVLKAAEIKQDSWSNPNSDHIALIGCSNNYFTAILALADPANAGGEAPGATSPFLEKGFADVGPDPHRARRLARAEKGKGWEELDEAQRKEFLGKSGKNVRTGLRSRALRLAPGGKIEHRFLLFLGSRDEAVLSRYPSLRLTEINDYGWYTVIVKVFLQILKGFHWLLRSWGLAIVGLTLLVRACLHPINRRQQASMMRYQKQMNLIKPEMDALKERYAQNRTKMNLELRRLFQENNVNPGQMMLGCLMIFFQLPIWYSLYNTINFSLDLRLQPFLWIPDLTQPDRLFSLPFELPFGMGASFNILPVLYVVLQILQQKMQPKPSDPQLQQQMRMMSFMMVFFGYLFYNTAAGFLLYFIASATIGMIESRIIKRMLARDGLTPGSAAGRAGAGSGSGRPGGSGGPLYPTPRKGKDSRRGSSRPEN